MTTRWRTVLQASPAFRPELHAVHDDHESRVVYDKDGPLAVLLPCLEDGTVDHSAVDEHNRGAGIRPSSVGPVNPLEGLAGPIGRRSRPRSATV